MKQQFLFCCQGNLKLRACPWSKWKFWIDLLFGQSSLNELLSLVFHFKKAKKKKRFSYQNVCHIRADLILFKIFVQLLICTYILFYPCFWISVTPALFVLPRHAWPQVKLNQYLKFCISTFWNDKTMCHILPVKTN